MTKETLAARLKELREAAGMTQQEMADKASLSLRTYQKIEQGSHETRWTTIEAIADALDVSTERFRDEPKDATPSKPGRPKKKSVTDGFVSIALVGSVAAGPGSLEEFQGEFIDVASFYVGCVAYLVRGNSMVESNIANGDFVIVRASPSAEIGEVVVAWKEGQGAMVKKLGARGMLLSCDSSRDKYKLDEDAGDRILGVLVGVVRRC